MPSFLECLFLLLRRRTRLRKRWKTKRRRMTVKKRNFNEVLPSVQIPSYQVYLSLIVYCRSRHTSFKNCTQMNNSPCMTALPGESLAVWIYDRILQLHYTTLWEQRVHRRNMQAKLNTPKSLWALRGFAFFRCPCLPKGDTFSSPPVSRGSLPFDNLGSD